MLDEFGVFFFQVKQVHGSCASTTRWFFFFASTKQLLKKCTPSREENKMAVDWEREGDVDYLSFWDAK